MTFAVIDTNVLVASLLTHNHDSATARVMDAVYLGKVVPILNDEILAEYREVLSRPHLRLDQAKCGCILSFITAVGTFLDPVGVDAEMPDEKDRVFYEVALAGQSQGDAWLVTGNMKHFPKADFVVTPAQFCDIFSQLRRSGWR